MQSDLFKKANKIWRRLTQGENEYELKFDMEIYRKLLNVFMAGDYYYYIFNVKDAAFDFMSTEITQVLGYSVEETSVPFFVNNIHPEDQPWFLSFENKVTEFFATLTLNQIPNYKVRYDYRVRKKNGEYIRILQQVVTIQYDGENLALRTLGVHTDITHLKKTGNPVLSFIGLNGEPSYLDVQVEKQLSINDSGLTRREYEILQHLAIGKSSEEIGNTLYISKQTVDTHRKNMLKKNDAANTAELVLLAVKKGWL